MTHRLLPHKWVKANCLNRNALPANLLPWLLHKASLTMRLRQHSKELKVRVLSQQLQPARYDEALQLKIKPYELVVARDVELICDNNVCVSAHSVFSKKIVNGKRASLSKIGTRPLIEILATDPNLQRSEIELVKLTPGDRDYERAVIHGKIKPASLWCRRSIFTFFDKPVLVSETFLPAILDLKKQSVTNCHGL